MKIINLWVICFSLILLNSNCDKEDEVSPPVEGIDFGNHNFGSMTDEEGNTYRTIQIGSAIWMAENLRVTRLNDGTSIQAVGPGTQWISNPDPAFYDASEEFIKIYGRLYNGHASIKACPNGWHLPSIDEWSSLASTVGGMAVAGGKIKEKGIQHWVAPNAGAENSVGFTGLPAGSIHIGLLRDRGSDGYWWANDQRTFYYASASIEQMRSKSTATLDNGMSIRCVKD